MYSDTSWHDTPQLGETELEQVDVNELFRQGFTEKAATLKTQLNVPQEGEPIFEIADLVTTYNPVARLLRYIFLQKHITKELLEEHHFESERAIGKLLRDINTSRNNMLKALKKSRMTVQQFERILDVLKLQILDFSYTIKDSKTGEVTTFSLSDIPKFLEDNDILVVDEEYSSRNKFSFDEENI